MSKTNRRFWNWVKNEQEENPVRELHINGVIAEESWYDDDVTPKLFREELLSKEGDVVLFLNSPGGDIFAASRIYTMLMEYKGSVTVKVDGIAASRDGSTGGFFADNVQASQQVWNTVNMLLRLEREQKV